MGPLIAQVLPLALGAMVSPVLLIAQVLVLTGGTKPIARALALTAGSAIALAAITAVILTAAASFNVSAESGHDVVGILLRAACSLALLALGIRSLATRGRSRTHASRRFADVPASRYLLIGLLAMSTNLTSLVLYIPAMHIIARAEVTRADQALAVALIFVLTMLPLWLPLAMAMSLGTRSASVLASMNSFMTRHQPSIDAAICFAFAAYLAYGAIKAI